MKKLLLTFILFFVISGNFINADDGDITNTEVKPDVVGYKLDTVKFLVVTKTCVVTYKKVDADGNSLGTFDVLFMNTLDDPETTEVDETDNAFTQLVTAINNGSNIRITIRNACKIKLGL